MPLTAVADGTSSERVSVEAASREGVDGRLPCVDGARGSRIEELGERAGYPQLRCGGKAQRDHGIAASKPGCPQTSNRRLNPILAPEAAVSIGPPVSLSPEPRRSDRDA